MNMKNTLYIQLIHKSGFTLWKEKSTPPPPPLTTPDKRKTQLQEYYYAKF